MVVLMQAFFLGDYMDRGPDSQTVLNTLIDGQLKNNNWKFLKGNHDRMVHGPTFTA